MDRRGFIKLIVGAAVGVNLTPLPWKTIDDVAIWTQNWPWVPRLDRYPDIQHRATICTLCSGGCGLSVRMVNNEKTVKVEGLPGSPVNRGRICPLGAAGPQYQYGLARYRSPLKRIGARGSGAYVNISWDEAFKIVGAKMAEIRARGEAHTVAMISGRSNDLTRMMAQRFMHAYGSPNFISMPGLSQSLAFAEKAQFGLEDAIGYDLENSRYILSFGGQLIEGWGSPVRSIQAFSHWRAQGQAKFVQIDTQATLTASKADEWVAVKPGTEAALALGLAYVIVQENLVDRNFLDQYASGYEEFVAMLAKDYRPDQVADITGVPADAITRLAKEFAQSKPALALPGRGKGDLPTPAYEVMAVMALNALVGNINQKGGLIIRKELPLKLLPEFEPDQAAAEGLGAPRLDLALSNRFPFTPSLLSEFIHSVETDRFYPVNMLILDQANPVYLGANGAAFRKALAKIPLIVTLSNQADDTSILADIVLPSASNFEGPVDAINPPGLPFPIFAAAKGIMEKSPFDTLPAADILVGLAKAIGSPVAEAMPFGTHLEMIQGAAESLMASGTGTIAEPLSEDAVYELGASVETPSFDDPEGFFEALTTGLFWFDPSFEYGRLDGAFKTASGKFEFLSQGLEEALAEFIKEKGEKGALDELHVSKGLDQLYMPHFEPSVPEVKEPFFPLLLVPAEQFKLVAEWQGNAPYLTKLLEDTTLNGRDLVVHVNPHTAEERHLHELDKAWLKTEKGQIPVLVHLFEGARPGVIYAPVGLGHRGYGYYLRGKGQNPLEIIEATTDPLSGQALWWGTPANLVKA